MPKSEASSDTSSSSSSEESSSTESSSNVNSSSNVTDKKEEKKVTFVEQKPSTVEASKPESSSDSDDSSSTSDSDSSDDSDSESESSPSNTASSSAALTIESDKPIPMLPSQEVRPSLPSYQPAPQQLAPPVVVTQPAADSDSDSESESESTTTSTTASGSTSKTASTAVSTGKSESNATSAATTSATGTTTSSSATTGTTESTGTSENTTSTTTTTTTSQQTTTTTTAATTNTTVSVQPLPVRPNDQAISVALPDVKNIQPPPLLAQSVPTQLTPQPPPPLISAPVSHESVPKIQQLVQPAVQQLPQPALQQPPQAAVQSDAQKPARTKKEKEHKVKPQKQDTKKPVVAVVQSNLQSQSLPAQDSPSVLTPPATNNRYDKTSASTDSTADSSSSSETNSSISCDDNAPEENALPTVIVKTVRETEAVNVDAAVETEYALQQELVIPSGCSRDVIQQLVTRVAHQESGGTHVTVACAFVACRSISLSDTESARLLFGSDEMITFQFLKSLLDTEASRIVTQRVWSLFRAHDRFRSGELNRPTVMKLLTEIGVCTCTAANGLVKVSLRDNDGSTRVLAHVVQTESDDTLIKDSDVEVSLKTFQMFFDAVRGEVVCNGVAICSRIIDPAHLQEVVQAIQVCSYVSNLVTAFEIEGEDCIEYEKLLKSLLAAPAPVISTAPEQPQIPTTRSKSFLIENITATLLAPLAHLPAAGDTNHIEPFLKKSLQLTEQRRANFIPQSLQLDRKTPLLETHTVFAVNVEEVHVPSAQIPPDARRYLTISTISKDNTVLPGVQIYAKAFKKQPPEKTWCFSKKKVRNGILVSGETTDELYVEVCFDVKDDKGRLTTSCLGFASTRLESLASGAIAVKPGTFFRRMSKEDPKEAESGGCLCFSAAPSTRIVLQVDPMTSFPADAASLGSGRLVVLERHLKLIAAFRDLLSHQDAPHHARVLRAHVAQQGLLLAENNDSLDELCECWDTIERKFSAEQRRDEVFVRQQLATLVQRVFAVSCISGGVESGCIKATVIENQPVKLPEGNFPMSLLV